MREIVIDTETTGLNPEDGHRIVEIGCIELERGVPTGRIWHRYVNPERPMPSAAEEIHGITDAFLADKPLFTTIADELVAFLSDAPLVIHNAAFDLGFLNAELARSGRIALVPARVVDTVELARRKYPGLPASLDALCKRFSIDLGAREKHGALVDARLLADVYLELTGGRQATLVLARMTATAVTAETAIAAAPLVRTLRVVDPSEAELAAHAALIAKLKDAIWGG
jgi:DNA polymerase-3 subunit epsilon